MRRWVFNFAAAVSLVLFLATVGLCVRSHFVSDSVYRIHQVAIGQRIAVSRSPLWPLFPHKTQTAVEQTVCLSSIAGELLIGWGTDSFPIDQRSDNQTIEALQAGVTSWHWIKPLGTTISQGEYEFLGFQYSSGTNGGVSATNLAIPDAAIAIIFVIVPVLWLSTRRLTTRSAGSCWKCGYSLTGNISGVCPECGTPVAEKVGAKA